MTLKELMERAGTTNQGYAIAYLKDSMREINMMIEECPVCMEKIEGSSSSR